MKIGKTVDIGKRPWNGNRRKGVEEDNGYRVNSLCHLEDQCQAASEDSCYPVSPYGDFKSI